MQNSCNLSIFKNTKWILDTYLKYKIENRFLNVYFQIFIKNGFLKYLYFYIYF